MFEDGPETIDDKIEGAEIAKDGQKASAKNENRREKQGVCPTDHFVVALQEKAKAKRADRKDGEDDQGGNRAFLHAYNL